MKPVILRYKNITERIDNIGRPKITKKEQKRYEDRLIDKLDSICSKIVMVRDNLKHCITKGISVCKDGSIGNNCCHAIKRGYYSCRRDLRNLYKGCSACNCWGLQDHDGLIVAQMIRIHGREVYDALRENRSTSKPFYKDMENLLEDRTSYYLSLTS